MNQNKTYKNALCLIFEIINISRSKHRYLIKKRSCGYGHCTADVDNYYDKKNIQTWSHVPFYVKDPFTLKDDAQADVRYLPITD